VSVQDVGLLIKVQIVSLRRRHTARYEGNLGTGTAHIQNSDGGRGIADDVSVKVVRGDPTVHTLLLASNDLGPSVILPKETRGRQNTDNNGNDIVLVSLRKQSHTSGGSQINRGGGPNCSRNSGLGIINELLKVGRYTTQIRGERRNTRRLLESLFRLSNIVSGRFYQRNGRIDTVRPLVNVQLSATATGVKDDTVVSLRKNCRGKNQRE
jgi:hypothetical protein